MQDEEKSVKERFPRQAKSGKSAALLENYEKDFLEKKAVLAESQEASEDEKKLAELRAQNAEKRMELFFREHDSTGSWKGERFHRDMAKGLRDRRLERNGSGEIEITEDDKKSHVLMVNMGELDRLNNIGGHEMGDQGLRLTLEFVENVIREEIGSLPRFKNDYQRLSSTYDIYRYSGNDFTITLNGVDADTAENIRGRVTKESVDLSSLRPDLEPVPLTASRVERADAIALVNRLGEKPEDAGLTEEGLLIDAVREKLQTLNDVAKLERRTLQMIEKIRDAGKDPDAETRVKEFYETFLKKSIGSVFRVDPSTESAEYVAFRNMLADKHAFDVPPPEEWTHFLAERALDGAFEQLKARRAVGRKIEINLARKVADEVLSRKEGFGRDVASEQSPPSLGGFVEPNDTGGKNKLNEKKEHARKQAEKDAGDPMVAEESEAALLDYQLELAKRNEQTGLYGRGVYFETMEAGLESGKPVTTVAIDMAFLKYFDKEGGPEAGNTAILKAAEILDGIATEFNSLKDGVEVVAYRTGGDEFALTIVGGDDKTVGEIVKSVRNATESAGRVPPSPGANATYSPESLQFNFGIRSAKSIESFREELSNAGFELPAKMNARMAADYLQRLADKEIDIHKGVNRLVLLVERSLEEDQTGESANFIQLANYSQKAVFGASGMKKVEEMVARLKKPDIDVKAEMGNIKGELLDFVLGEIEKKNTNQARLGAELDRRVEDAVKYRYLENRIEELKDEVADLRMKLDKERSSRSSVESALRAAQDELRAVINLRERINPQASGSGDTFQMQAAE